MEREELRELAKEIEQVFNTVGVYASLQYVAETPLVNRFDYNLRNLEDIRKVKKVVEIISICKHLKLKQVESQNFHFAIEMEKDTKSINILNNTTNNGNRLEVALGINNYGEQINFDLRKAIHTLIGGATGMGKTNIINNIIYGLTKQNTPEQLQIYMIDIKKTLSIWNGLQHLKNKPIKDCSDALDILEKISKEMEKRFRILEREKKTKADIDTFPYIVVIIDELADLMLSGLKSWIEQQIQHIAQIGRAVNISLIVATQNPIVKVCTNLIKTNCPTRIALKTASIVDSKNILDNKKAFELNGIGNAIIRCAGDMNEKNFKAYKIEEEQILEYVEEQNGQK